MRRYVLKTKAFIDGEVKNGGELITLHNDVCPPMRGNELLAVELDENDKPYPQEAVWARRERDPVVPVADPEPVYVAPLSPNLADPTPPADYFVDQGEPELAMADGPDAKPEKSKKKK